MLEAIMLVIAGILAVPSLHTRSKNQDAYKVISKISPYQRWIGLIIFIWGVWSLISVIRYSDILIDHGYISLWILSVSIAVVATVLGFILGFNLIDQYVLSKLHKRYDKDQTFIEKLLPLQNIFGIIAIILGIIAFIYILVFPF